MKKQMFLVLSVVFLLTACNNATETAAPATATPQGTTVKVEVEQPKPEGTKVEVDNGGVKIDVKGPDGSQIKIEGDNPK